MPFLPQPHSHGHAHGRALFDTGRPALPGMDRLGLVLHAKGQRFVIQQHLNSQLLFGYLAYNSP